MRWASTSVPTRRLRLVEKTKHYCITKYKLPLLGSWRSETATEESRAALPQIQQKGPRRASCQRFRIESLLGIGETLTRGNDFLFGGVSTSPVVARQDFLARLQSLVLLEEVL